MSETTDRPVRFYTRARKFPRLIGQTLDGRRLPGGPYTWPQLALTAAVFFLATRTVPLWARGSGLQTIMIIAFLTAGALIVGRQMPQVTRNPLLLLAGLVRVLSGPRHGRLRNRPLRMRPPHPVKGLCLIDQRGLANQAEEGPSPEVPPDNHPVGTSLAVVESPAASAVDENEAATPPTPPAPTPVPLSRVAALLSQAVSGDRDA